jgi:hypothetical protein
MWQEVLLAHRRHRCSSAEGAWEKSVVSVLYAFAEGWERHRIGAWPTADSWNRAEHRCFPLLQLLESWGTSVFPPPPTLGIARNVGVPRSANFPTRAEHRCSPLRQLPDSCGTSVFPTPPTSRLVRNIGVPPSANFRKCLLHRCRRLPGNRCPVPTCRRRPGWPHRGPVAADGTALGAALNGRSGFVDG